MVSKEEWQQYEIVRCVTAANPNHLPVEEAQALVEIMLEELAEEKAWEESYQANQDKFRAIAQEALNDLEAGETLEMVIENGKVVTR